MNTYSTWDDPWGPLAPEVLSVAEYWLDADVSKIGTTPYGLLVGEQPGPSHNPRLPLWPWPTNSAGGRLFRMSGATIEDYLGRLARVNLARRPVEKWDHQHAASRMASLLDRAPAGASVVLCGVKARAAYEDWFTVSLAMFEWHRYRRGIDVAYIPHPSGRNRLYNDQQNVIRAGDVLRRAMILEGEPSWEA